MTPKQPHPHLHRILKVKRCTRNPSLVPYQCETWRARAEFICMWEESNSGRRWWGLDWKTGNGNLQLISSRDGPCSLNSWIWASRSYVTTCRMKQKRCVSSGSVPQTSAQFLLFPWKLPETAMLWKRCEREAQPLSPPVSVWWNSVMWVSLSKTRRPTQWTLEIVKKP